MSNVECPIPKYEVSEKFQLQASAVNGLCQWLTLSLEIVISISNGQFDLESPNVALGGGKCPMSNVQFPSTKF